MARHGARIWKTDTLCSQDFTLPAVGRRIGEMRILVVNPSGVLETWVTGMGATRQTERRGGHRGLEADGLGHTLGGQANG